MDFDMAILASPSVEYYKYADQVRREYHHVSTLAWCFGRSRFLYQTAANEAPIFATETFRSWVSEERSRRFRVTPW